MKREQILATFRSLACSQGMYGRLLNDLANLSPEEYDEVMTDLENQHFADALDLVMYIEG